MKKLRLIALIFILCFAIAGCASLQKAASETTPEQVTQMQATVASATTPYIPAPYQIPAALIIGYLASVAKNWFKNKTASKNAT